MMRNLTTKLALAALAAGAGLAVADPAAAQATRTWVSGVGDDANPCSRTAPCRTFAGAIPKTAAGGEINCLDPGAYGQLTITKSIKILCDGIAAGILLTAGNGINVNAGASDIVVISGVTIEGFGMAGSGIRFNTGGGLHIRNTTIKGFRTATSYAVNFAPTTPNATLMLENVTLANNGIANNSGAVVIQPGNGLTATFAVDNTKFSDNGGAGVRVDLTGTTGTTAKGTVTNSVFNNSGLAVFVRAPGGGVAEVLAKDNVISGGQTGLVAQDPGATLNASGNVIHANSAFGVRALNGAALVSYGDNELVSNGNNGVFTATVGKQ